jgi:hypothetical protein
MLVASPVASGWSSGTATDLGQRLNPPQGSNYSIRLSGKLQILGAEQKTVFAIRES